MSERAAALCMLCRGSKGLCGKNICPVYVFWNAVESVRAPKGILVDGSSPPSVFVGRVGYPKVRVSPAVPPFTGDTRVYDEPEKWLGLGLNEILNMRLSLVRGIVEVNARKSQSIEELQLLAISSRPVEVELRFAKPPKPTVKLDVFAPPMGPSGPVEGLRLLEDPKPLHPLEKVYYDSDLKAGNAIVYLYNSGVPVSTIQRALSVGALGTGFLRKLVPTRWSITAVDDMVSKSLIDKVKGLKYLDSYLFFERRHLNNTFVAIIAPGAWSYEWIEAWFPHTTWNPGKIVEVEGDWESYHGRKTYASLGGCYYAARLAAAEYMLKEGIQGTVVLIREIYEGFFLPIGVWFVRENVRALFRGVPERYDTLNEVLQRLGRSTRLPLSVWLKKSALLKTLIRQERLESWLK